MARPEADPGHPTGGSAAAPLVTMRGVWKRFGATHALSGARLDVRAGEVLGVLGENGAGKTTLLSVLAGSVVPDAGELRLRGRRLRVRTPREAWRSGIGMVHQHFALVPRFTVLENLALGHRRSRAGFDLALDRVGMRAAALADATGLDVPLGRRVEDLGVGDRQRAEILKVLLRDPQVVVLDEPTAVLSPPEVERLSALLRHLADEGRAVVLVAHKLDEVLAVADRVTVLREGRTVLEAPAAGLDLSALTRAMVGDERAAPVGIAPAGARHREADATRGPGRVGAPGEVVARLDAVGVRGPDGEPELTGVSIEVRRGEIVAVAGIEGNGQRALARVLAGRQRVATGRAEIPPDPAFIPQDRRREGLVPSFSIEENVALALQREPRYRLGVRLAWRAIRERSRSLMEQYRILAPDPSTRVDALSGGNQQRVVVARELSRDATLVVAENPTRGLDVAAARDVHERLLDFRRRGPSAPGIVLLSTDLDEVLALADRVTVLVRGRLWPVPDADRTRAGVGRLMLTGTRGEAAS